MEDLGSGNWKRTCKDSTTPYLGSRNEDGRTGAETRTLADRGETSTTTYINATEQSYSRTETFISGRTSYTYQYEEHIWKQEFAHSRDFFAMCLFPFCR